LFYNFAVNYTLLIKVSISVALLLKERNHVSGDVGPCGSWSIFCGRLDVWRTNTEARRKIDDRDRH
jgi:hypothetical protein